METESVWRRGRGPGKLGQLVGLNATLTLRDTLRSRPVTMFSGRLARQKAGDP